MTRLLVFSDLHLGKGMDYSADRLDDYAQTLSQIHDLATEGGIDAVLFAGDFFEGPHVPSAHYLLAADHLPDYLPNDYVPWIAINGNGRHDSAAAQGDSNAIRVLAHLKGWEYATRPALLPIPFHEPQLTVACLPWVGPSLVRQATGDADMADERIAAFLVGIAEGLRAQARDRYPDLPCFLLGHWATTGWRLPTGLATDQLREPRFPVEELARMEFAASFFGHVHVPGLIAPDVYSVGSPLCLDFGEAHIAHGCWLWDDGVPEFLPLEYRPFVAANLDADEAYSISEGHGVGWDVEDAVVRVRYTATMEQAQQIDHATLRMWLMEAGAHRVWQIIPEIERPARARVEGMGALHPYEAIDAWIEAQGREIPEIVRERGRDVLKEVAA